MAQAIDQFYQLCNPTLPLQPDDPRYVPCTNVRGEGDVVQWIAHAIRRETTPQHILFTGHRSAGKSTELLRLMKLLGDPLSADPYFVVYFEADKEDIDLNDSEPYHSVRANRMATELNDIRTETAEEVLARLERMIRRAGEFALGFVGCNSPLQCSQMSAALKEHLSDLRFLDVALDEPIISLMDRIEERWDTAAPPDLVCVYGLETSIYPDRDYSPVLGRLNPDRELIRKAIPVPVLIWLPDFAVDRVVRSAPDFWAWRSGVYEFPNDATNTGGAGRDA